MTEDDYRPTEHCGLNGRRSTVARGANAGDAESRPSRPARDRRSGGAFMNQDPTRCPVCGQHNHCGLMQGKSHCWCFDQPIPEKALAQVPEEARDVACLCRPCALGEHDFEHAQEQLSDLIKNR